MMIRKIYINNLILNLYLQLPRITFPLNLDNVLNLIPNCKIMSYQKFAQLNNCTIQEVINICQSKSGCTNYDIKTNRYLIMLNLAESSNYGRRKWTIAHEIGHIQCGHFAISAMSKISKNSFQNIKNKDYELEADYFAATLLAPLPLFKIFEIKSPVDIQNIFGLSMEASLYRYNEYIQWKINHRKTAWENDIVNLYKQKDSLCQ